MREPPSPSTVPAIARPISVVAVAAAYLLAAIVGLASTQDTNGLAALWPSDAILLAALLLRPQASGRLIAWCLCAAFAANLWFGASPLDSLWLAIAAGVGVLAGAMLGVRIGVGPCSFDRPAEVVRFCAVAVVAAVAGATIAALPAFAELGGGSGIWLAWFLSDLLGMLVLTPLALMLALPRRAAPVHGILRRGEPAALLVLVAMTAGVVFFQSSYPLLFLPVAPMMIVAYRVGPTGTAAGILVIAGIGTLATLAGLGPVALASGSIAIHVHFLQFYLATLFSICLPMAAALTHRNRLAAIVRESEARHRRIVERSHTIIFETDTAGRWTYLNPTWTALTGRDAAASLGEPILAAVLREDRRALIAALRPLRAGAVTNGGAGEIAHELRYRDAAGAVRWAHVAAFPMRADDDSPIGFHGTIEDVTDRRADHAALRESHRLLSLAGRVSRVGHWRLDVAAAAVHWSEEVHRMHGVPVADGTPPLEEAIDFYHPDDRAMVTALVERALSFGEGFEFNARIVARDGVLRHIVSNGQVERSAGGAVSALIGVIQDITERRIAELELRESEERFRIITEQAGDMISLHEISGEALFVSPSARVILGHDPRDAFGASAFGWVAGDADRATLSALRHEVMIDGSPSGRVEMRRADGRVAWMEVRPRLTEIAGEPRVIAVWRDVTDHVEREAELRAARAQAEAGLSAKAEFLANMSHEIRTPMNGVIGFTELLLAGDLDDEQRHHAQLIADSGEAMMRLLNDILDLSKIDAGRLEIAAEPIDLAHTLAGCIRLVAPAAERKGLALALDVAGDLPRVIRGDALRVRQVVLNLLGNAVKFTAAGGVTLSARVTGDRIAVAVADTGIGIAPERQDAIFEQFVQADHSITRAYGGTGLGLAISNRLATLMGGGLALASAPGRGTTITLDLPLVALDDAALPPRVRPVRVTAVPGRSAHLLLAEDHDINQILVTSMLARAGHRITVAADGAAALAQVEAAIAAGTPFDIVLMDVQMPVMDGLSATRAIRALGGIAATLPIVALTANAFATDLAACRAAGMDDHLAKPVSSERLLAAIDRWAPATVPARRAAFKPNAALAARYAAQRTETLAAVDALIRDGALAGASLDALAGLLHKLAGTAAMFGEAELGDRARDLELGLRNPGGDALIAVAERLRAAA